MIKFGTDGWRAVISDEFTFENVRKVAASIAAYLYNHKLNGKPLVIGYDARFLADKFAEAVAAVMENAGINVLLCERDTPTPVTAWEVVDRGAAGAVMLTASHNPPQYCGLKFIPDYAGPATEDITKEIEEKILTPSSLLGHPSPSRGEVERIEPRERYFKYIERFLDLEALRKAKLKIVVDPMYGSGRGYLDKLLERFGCQTEEIHGFRDVLFGGRNPEPEDQTLSELKMKVKEFNADLGLALDGDADRFGVVDEAGDFYSANQIISMVFDYLVRDKGYTGGVVRSLATTHMIDAIAQQHKIKVWETPVGFKHIAQVMMNEEIILGGEESGGFSIKGHIPEKDGILADLLVAEMVAKAGRPLSKIWEDLVSRVGTYQGRRGKVEVEEEKKRKIMKNLREKPPQEIEGIKVTKVNTVDGVKMLLEDGSWLLIRPSGTEPLLRIYAESKNSNSLDKIDQFCYNLIGRK